MVTISCDLDGTLIETRPLYENSQKMLASYISNNYNVSYNAVRKAFEEINRASIQTMGISRRSYIHSNVKTLRRFVSPSPFAIHDVCQIADYPFLTVDEYKERGFLSDSIENFLQILSDSTFRTVLLTVGDREYQQRKIDGLDLDYVFDDIRIVNYGEKEHILSKFSEAEEKVVHIGNSASSDIKPCVNLGITGFYIPHRDWMKSDISIEDHEMVFEQSSLTDVLSHSEFPTLS